MVSVEIVPNIFWTGVNDRTTDLFEGLWPISDEGVSYNSYVITDEKIALIDLVKGFKVDDYLTQLEEIVDPSKIDYVIINHTEPDHTGMIKVLNKISPDITFVGTERTKKMLMDYYQLSNGEKFMVVQSGDTLSLGKHTLVFYETPFVHWPETMVTYETKSKILKDS